MGAWEAAGDAQKKATGPAYAFPVALAHVEQYAPCVGGALAAYLDLPAIMSRHLHTDTMKNFSRIFDAISNMC
jgi:hypothetical protein